MIHHSYFLLHLGALLDAGLFHAPFIIHNSYFLLSSVEGYRSGHNGPVLKTGVGVTRPWVRIPPPPPLTYYFEAPTLPGS